MRGALAFASAALVALSLGGCAAPRRDSYRAAFEPGTPEYATYEGDETAGECESDWNCASGYDSHVCVAVPDGGLSLPPGGEDTRPDELRELRCGCVGPQDVCRWYGL